MLIPKITLASGGIIETALLPYHLIHLLSFFDLNVTIALSNSALQFVTTLALESITGNNVYIESSQISSETKVPYHLSLGKNDLLIIYPCTPRILVQLSNGEITCPVTRLFAFTAKNKIVVVPFLHELMEDRIYQPHIEKLREIGCTVLLPEKGLCWQTNAWRATENYIRNAFQLQVKNNPKENVEITTLHKK